MYYQKQLDKMAELLIITDDNVEDNDCILSQSYLDALVCKRNANWLIVLPQIMKKIQPYCRRCRTFRGENVVFCKDCAKWATQ